MPLADTDVSACLPLAEGDVLFTEHIDNNAQNEDVDCDLEDDVDDAAAQSPESVPRQCAKQLVDACLHSASNSVKRRVTETLTRIARDKALLPDGAGFSQQSEAAEPVSAEAVADAINMSPPRGIWRTCSATGGCVRGSIAQALSRGGRQMLKSDELT